MSSRFAKRLQKELNDLQKKPPSGIQLAEVRSLQCWIVSVFGAPGTLYANQVFQLQFSFPEDYPLHSPEVIFVGNRIPVHPHIYSNGHICLSILYDSWSPALSVCSVCLSILSMLSSNTTYSRPPDNDIYVQTAMGKSPKHTKWL